MLEITLKEKIKIKNKEEESSVWKINLNQIDIGFDLAIDDWLCDNV